MKTVTIFVVFLFSCALISCGGQPESVEVTKIVEVTRLVPEYIEVEITVPVEYTKEVVVRSEVEVTRLVEVEKIITATPLPTEEINPALTPTEQPSPTYISVRGSLLSSMKAVRENLRDLGGMLDGSGSMSAQSVVEIYDSVEAAPDFNVTGESSTVQAAYTNYRSAISIFLTGSRDLALHARDFLASGAEGSSIPFQQWGVARQSINDALDKLNPAIESLE